MDLLTLIKPSELADFLNAYSYKTSFMGDVLFPARKTNDLKVTMRLLQENGDLPVMAQVHSLDAEARIGDRPDFKEIEVAKLLIKEKLNQTERIAEFLGHTPTNDEVVKFIFNDLQNLISRVLTRNEVMKMEVMANGEATISENNVNMVVGFGVEDKNKILLSNWSNPNHDIIGDLETIKSRAKQYGFTIVNALTSSKVVGYIRNNNAIKDLFKNSNVLPTTGNVLNFVNSNFEINFAVNDDVYKKSATDKNVYRFFPENKITFFGDGAFGAGLYGVTPEERQLASESGVKLTEEAFVSGLIWKTPDPVATWTKASAMYIPVPKNVNHAFYCTVS